MSASEHLHTELEGESRAPRASYRRRVRVCRRSSYACRPRAKREELTARTRSAVAERARQELPSCPRCPTPLLGPDVLVSGRRPNCDKALTSLLAPTRFAVLVENEYLALSGLSVLAGLAIATSAEHVS